MAGKKCTQGGRVNLRIGSQSIVSKFGGLSMFDDGGGLSIKVHLYLFFLAS
jgi:hypothetical protein